MTFAEYLLNRDEELAFSILEESLQNEGLMRGLRGIWNIARGGRYNQQDAKSAVNTSNLIANAPEMADAGKGIFDFIRNLGLSAGVAMGGGDANYKPPEPTPIVKAYNPPVQKSNEADPFSVDIYRSAKASREDAQKAARGYAKATAFGNLARRHNSLDFIDQTPSL